MMKVQAKACSTCPYKKGSPLDPRFLEEAVADGYGGFTTFRECHSARHGSGVCCRGFWNRNKDKFPLGQVAQRLKRVEFVTDLRRKVMAKMLKQRWAK